MIGYKIVKVCIRPQQLHMIMKLKRIRNFLLGDKLGLADEITAGAAAYDAFVCCSKKHAVLQCNAFLSAVHMSVFCVCWW